MALEGEVKLEYGNELIHLDKGDSVYIYAAIPHVLAPAGRGTAKVLSVSYDPPPTGGHRHAAPRGASRPNTAATPPRKAKRSAANRRDRS
jgi:mannose-6-phosphate isomerase-like protein (cupin superfamily)